MASTINADNGVVSGSSGVKTTADTSGVLALQSNGSTGVTLDTNLNVGIGRSPVTYGSFKVLDVAGASGAIQKWVHTGSTVELQAYASSSLTAVGSATNHPLLFVTNDTERFRVGTAGQLGIGGANYGTAGQVLTSNGSGSAPTWQAGGGGSAATPTALGTVYGSQTTGGGTPYLTAYGYNAGLGATGTYCTYIGRNVGDGSPTGVRNVIVGVNAFEGTGTGNYNTGVGFGVFAGTSSGSNNSALGNGALNGVSTGASNVGIGFSAMSVLSTASQNVAVGEYALNSNNADNNTAVGHRAAFVNTTGSGNVAIGYQSLYSNTTGIQNVALGYQALFSQTVSGDGNVGVGYRAGYSNTGGYNCIFIGQEAGFSATAGNYATYIGYRARGSTTTETDSLVVASGYNSGGAVGKGSSTAFITGAGGSTYNGGNTSTWNTTSDQRLKKNIVDNNDGLEKINSIRVRNFEYRLPEEITELDPSNVIKKEGVQLGVIAQELQAVLPECVKQESTGVLSVDPDNLTWYLINAVKELTARIAVLEGK